MAVLGTKTIKWSLVLIQVRIHSALIEKPRGKLVRKADEEAVQLTKTAGGEAVEQEDIVHRFEAGGGATALIEKDELAELRQAVSKEMKDSMTVAQIIPSAEIPLLLIEKPYYLEPVLGFEQPYTLFCETLKKLKRAAMVQFVLRSGDHENLGVIMPQGKVLTLLQLRYASELKPLDHIVIPDVAIERPHAVIAKELAERRERPLNVADYQDTYQERLQQLIEARARQAPAASPTQTAASIPDLMATLRASVEAQAESKPPRKIAPSRTTKQRRPPKSRAG